MAPDPGDSRLIGRRVQGDIRLAEVFYPAGLRQSRHRHETPTFTFVASGRYGEQIGRSSHDRHGSTVVFHPAGEYHAVRFETDVTVLSVDFQDPPPSAISLERGSSHSSDLIAWLGSRLIREMARTDSASVLAVDGLIAEMLAEGSRARTLSEESRNPAWFLRAADFIHENFTDTFTLDEVAEIAGVHPAHLSRTFRQKMGYTIGHHVRRLRFEFACGQIL